MDNKFQHRVPQENQQPTVYTGSFLETLYTGNRPPTSIAPPETTQGGPSPSLGSTQPDHAAPRWTPSPGYIGQRGYGFNFLEPSSRGGGFGVPCLAPPYGFDLSVPPPPLGCPPPGRYPNTVPSCPLNIYNSLPQRRGGLQPPNHDFQPVSDCCENRQQEYGNFRETGALFGGPLLPILCQDHDRRPVTATALLVDEAVFHKRQAIQWLRRFLQNSGKVSKSLQTRLQRRKHHSCVPALREALYVAVRLVSALEDSCQTLKHNAENDCIWADSYLTVLNMKREVQDKMKHLSDKVKTKPSPVGRRRVLRLRANKLLQLEKKHRQEHISEKEAAMDTWRLKQIHDVEERKKEQELKLAADSVLCEVRKKQADVMRMQDILRSLEKLRRLRKEAASRKGIITEQECDKVFSSQLEQLRSVMKKRTAVYSAEEKALMVMLEGEQERHVKKERERQLQRKHRMSSILFGDELPVDSVLQPFREYYTQAQQSLHTLIQIRREWDMFVVAADHPDGSPVPLSWILPCPPLDQYWASALHTADTDDRF